MKKIEYRDLCNHLSPAALDAYNDSDLEILENDDGTLRVSLYGTDIIGKAWDFEDLETFLTEDKSRLRGGILKGDHTMKKSEVIRAHYDEILNAMKSCYEDVIRSGGRIQTKVYVWEDGELEYLTDAQGSNTFLAPRDMETRELYYVATIEAPYFDVWDFATDPKPEDPEEAERMEQELIDWYLEDGTREQMVILLDAAIENAEMDEQYREEGIL